jgi:hypothetical protein
MAIKRIDIFEYKQQFIISKEQKSEYGEIFTPFFLIETMFETIPKELFSNPDLKWLDPGAGTGYFSMYLYDKLNKGLAKKIVNKGERHNHIIRNMIYIVEIQQKNIESLLNLFGEDANIIHADYTLLKSNIKFDIIIGNPPYNSNGLKKVPTQKGMNKKLDGKTIWISFIKQSISLLKPAGNLLMIVPSIWMKPDKARMYHFLMEFNIQKIRCYNNTETNKLFSGEAQTPTCFFLLTKEQGKGNIKLFDKDREKFIEYPIKIGDPIPVFGQTIIKKLKPFVEAYGDLKVIKTNLPIKGHSFSDTPDKEHTYINIRTAILDFLQPKLVLQYSSSPQMHHGQPKLILPHKMYGFPFIDYDGKYGISNRDNYVITNRPIEELVIIKEFLSTKTALYIFEATRYRMKYLEKYAFQLIPDIPKLVGLSRPITDDTIAKYFNFDSVDKENIQILHKKEYVFTYQK